MSASGKKLSACTSVFLQKLIKNPAGKNAPESPQNILKVCPDTESCRKTPYRYRSVGFRAFWKGAGRLKNSLLRPFALFIHGLCRASPKALRENAFYSHESPCRFVP
jgi:hypothetical protein